MRLEIILVTRCLARPRTPSQAARWAQHRGDLLKLYKTQPAIKDGASN